MSLEIATFGSGCFWCSEAVYLRVPGVKSVTSGYMGGTVPNPTYEQVCTGLTGHAEVIQIEIDTNDVTFEQLVRLFFKSHDPTTLNRQGHDVGTQYRSVIFTHSPQQQTTAEAVRMELDATGLFSGPIVTFIDPAQTFYPAEDYHKNYFALHPNQPYCANVIAPKLAKLENT